MDERIHKKSEPSKPPAVRLQTNFRLGAGTGSALPYWEKPTKQPKPPKPPWLRRVKDRNLEAAKPVLKVVAREGIVEFVKWLLFGRRIQSAEGAP